jgi:hypothetical protein
MLFRVIQRDSQDDVFLRRIEGVFKNNGVHYVNINTLQELLEITILCGPLIVHNALDENCIEVYNNKPRKRLSGLTSNDFKKKIYGMIE